jgi:signal transduction histidine kinase
VALAAAAGTAAVVALPFVRFAYRAPALHVALETTNALVALLVGYLVYGRFRESRRAQELLIAQALCTAAVANLLLSALPLALPVAGGGDFSRWAAVATRFLGTILLVAAALVPPAVRIRQRSARRLVGALVAAVTAVGVAGIVSGGDRSELLLAAPPMVVGIQAAGVVLYAVAAISFTRQAARAADELFRWMAAGCVLAAFARVHYLLFPSLSAQNVYTGDLLRLGFYLLLLVGAAREIRSYWELRARTAVLEDRRRMARDLHDGLAQELSYLWTQSRALTGGAIDAGAVDTGAIDAGAIDRLGGAAARALDEARRAIAALTRPLDEPFPRVLQQVADDLGSRYDVKVVTDVDPYARVDPGHGEALLRIASEAVRNAVRHGAASRIEVGLTARPLILTVTDDGRGFDAGSDAVRRTGGFGLTSMRERARAIGAELTITSHAGEGTVVRLTR